LMDIVITETERLNQLLTDFLNYARPHPPVFQPCDIHQILEETLLLLRNGRSPASSVEIVRSFHHGQGPSPRMDPFQIKQVFWNLCLNALQSMPSGGTLHLSTRQVGFHDLPRKLKAYWRSMGEAPRAIGGRQNEISTTHDPLSAADQAFLEVTIADTGPGISAEDQAKIFDPFYTTRDRGNGLGLAIVYRIIEEHHGFIHLESKPAQGTAFKVYLPI
ncbi:MAG: hypothetical protein HYY20_14360, partial [Candidatus Tectomicrobia bacterium]|nr:hypothetical protein [Candidatus Tectomicrobia bacterium]